MPVKKRFGKQIQHSISVGKVQGCFSSRKNYRYTLNIPYKGRKAYGGDIVSVVLKNPSSANINYADVTVRRVEEYVYRRYSKCRRLFILNLFAYRATSPRYVDNQIRKMGCASVVGPHNDSFLKFVFGISDYIIVAWGGSNGIKKSCYDSRIARVRKFLRPYAGKIRHVASRKKTKYPRHGQVWSYSDRIRKFKI